MIIEDRSPVVYDAGALLAAERNDRTFLAIHTRLLQAECEVFVPAPVLAQVWRGTARQAPMSRVLKACHIEATSETVARNAGVLLGRSRTSDAVDAIVVATAIDYAALLATSDPDDLNLLWGVSRTSLKPAMIYV